MTASNTPAPKAVEALPVLPDAPFFYNREGAAVWRQGYAAALAAARAEQAKPATYERGIRDAVDWVRQRAVDYDADHGSTDPETGTREYPGAGDEYVEGLQEIIEGITALSPQPPSPDVERQAVGWRVVPIVPTQDMLFAAELCKPRGYHDLFAAMLAAAPTPPQEAGDADAERLVLSLMLKEANNCCDANWNTALSCVLNELRAARLLQREVEA